ncbi:hypothetical protein QJQ45_019162, partial [Haematococcus lacustris]
GKLGPGTALYLHPSSDPSSPTPPSASPPSPPPHSPSHPLPAITPPLNHKCDPEAGEEQAEECDRGRPPSAACPLLVLVNAVRPPAQMRPRNELVVRCSDGEWFPVKRQLLRPCLALTQVVRSTTAGQSEGQGGEEEGEVAVEVDALTFDRVLLFLEAQHLGRAPPDWSLMHLEGLLQAAGVLGLTSLEQHCQARLRGLHSGLRVWRFAEVEAANATGPGAAGEARGGWGIMDGMVLDVTRWLPEHPGGSSIIPRQALNRDSSRFFENYHATRESFLYLREFYRGEIHQDDIPCIPPVSLRDA